MSVSTISMLHARNLVIDFAFPYDYDGVHALEKAPTIEESGLTTLTAPFTVGAWGGLIAAFVVVSVSLYVSMYTSARVEDGMKSLVKRPGFKAEVLLYVLNSLTRYAIYKAILVTTF